MQITLLALEDLEIDGVPVSTGTTFEVSPIHAAALTYQHKARFSTPTDTSPDLAPTPTTPATRKKRATRRYRRRDLRAES
jgi:hypothetical protein